MNGFRRLKIELAVIVLLDVVAVLISVAVDLPAWQEFAALALVGGGGALWLMLRVRRLSRRLNAEWEAQSGAQQ